MSKRDEKLRAMYLAGTVSVPPMFPELAKITFSSGGKGQGVMVKASQRLTPKLKIRRTFFLKDVMSLFLPDDPMEKIDLTAGDWYESAELKAYAKDNRDDSVGVEGIIYVREDAQSLLEVEAGLTAAENVEYYPPLPDDRSVNHYEMDPTKKIGCPR